MNSPHWQDTIQPGTPLPSARVRGLLRLHRWRALIAKECLTSFFQNREVPCSITMAQPGSIRPGIKTEVGFGGPTEERGFGGVAENPSIRAVKALTLCVALDIKEAEMVRHI